MHILTDREYAALQHTAQTVDALATQVADLQRAAEERNAQWDNLVEVFDEVARSVVAIHHFVRHTEELYMGHKPMIVLPPGGGPYHEDQ